MRIFAILLVSLYVPLSVVSADRNDMIDEIANESWISPEDFETMLQVSFNRSECCNVFIFGESLAIENIFNEFARFYPYEYQMNTMTYNCTGYLMISSSVEKIVKEVRGVPTIISTTEVLIIVNGDVKNDYELLDVSVYQNSKVNIVARNGLWTISEFFLSPRVFKQVSSYDEMTHHQGILDLQGRELRVATFYKPPLCYLKTINRTANGNDGEFFDTRNQSELDGIEVKLFMLIADRLNFTWTIRRPNDGARYGKRNGTDWLGGLVGLIFHKEVDIAFGGVWIVLDQYPFANMSHPWTHLSVRFLVPRPKPHRSFWALIRPLSPEVWWAVLATVIAQSIYVCTRARIDPRIPRRFRSLAITWTEMMGRLVGTYAPRSMRGLRLDFQLWHFLGILLVTCYSSNLAARLASVGFEKRIDTLREFIEKNLTWGVEGPTPTFTLYFNINDRYASQFPSRYQQEANETERHDKVLSGKYAIIGRILGTTFIPEEFVRDEDLIGYRLMNEAAGGFSTTFLVQAWLLPSVDRVMLDLLAAGIVKHHIDDVLHRRTKNVLREVLFEYDGSDGFPRVLDLAPLGVGFSILILGLFLSTLIFYLELRFGSDKKLMHEAPEKIARNRHIWQAAKHRRKHECPMSKNWNENKYRLFLPRRN